MPNVLRPNLPTGYGVAIAACPAIYSTRYLARDTVNTITGSTKSSILSGLIMRHSGTRSLKVEYLHLTHCQYRSKNYLRHFDSVKVNFQLYFNSVKH
jgi:hypothetical protein